MARLPRLVGTNPGYIDGTSHCCYRLWIGTCPLWRTWCGAVRLAGFFVRMRIPVPADVGLLELSASEYGVLWTPLSPFYLGHTGVYDLRLSCSCVDPDQIELGVVRLARFLRDVTLAKRLTGDNSRWTACVATIGSKRLRTPVFPADRY